MDKILRKKDGRTHESCTHTQAHIKVQRGKEEGKEEGLGKVGGGGNIGGDADTATGSRRKPEECACVYFLPYSLSFDVLSRRNMYASMCTPP